MIEIEYYKFEDGTNPIDPYLDELDIKMRAKAFRAIALLEEFGVALREPHSKYLTDGIYELRIRLGSNIERVLYFFYMNDTAVLTNGFTKKQQKTPKKEIEIAIKRKKEYERRYRNNE